MRVVATLTYRVSYTFARLLAHNLLPRGVTRKQHVGHDGSARGAPFVYCVDLLMLEAYHYSAFPARIRPFVLTIVTGRLGCGMFRLFVYSVLWLAHDG